MNFKIQLKLILQYMWNQITKTLVLICLINHIEVESFCQATNRVMKVSATSTVRGKLIFKHNLNGKDIKVPAKSLTVLLVPDLGKNGNVFSRDNACTNNKAISSANVVVTATNDEGVYYFNRVTPGAYFIKACTNNGIMHRFELSNNNSSVFMLPQLVANNF